jgi:hypothetical protein
MPVTGGTTFQFMGQDRSVCTDFHTEVSLHSHTMYSEESLETISHYTAKVPYLNRAIGFEGAQLRREGGEFDFYDAFWTPPLSPRRAYRPEERQIQTEFQLPALVSIADHDDIQRRDSAAGLRKLSARTYLNGMEHPVWHNILSSRRR